MDFFNLKKIAAKPDDQFFLAGIRDYKHNLFRMAKSILHNDADAEDAVGEAICKAYGKLDSLRSMNSFKPWIMKILINECYSAARRQSRIDYQPEVGKNVAVTQENPFPADQELWSVVYQLEQEFRTVVVLFYYEDLKIKDIAKVLGLSEGTVKSRLSRAKQKLKVLLEDEGGIIDGSI